MTEGWTCTHTKSVVLIITYAYTLVNVVFFSIVPLSLSLSLSLSLCAALSLLSYFALFEPYLYVCEVLDFKK